MLCWGIGKVDVKCTLMHQTMWNLLTSLVQDTDVLFCLLLFIPQCSSNSVATAVSVTVVRCCRSSSNPDMHTVGSEDEEVNTLARGLDRTCSMRTGELHRTVCAQVST
jgi:hypothetical protein